MKQPSDQLKLGAILSYVSTGLNMAVQLLYTPLMIRLLGQSEYGLYTLVGSVVSYLSLFSLGFTGAYLRFYSQRRAKNDEEGIARLNGMFLTVFCVMSLAVVLEVVLLILKKQNGIRKVSLDLYLKQHYLILPLLLAVYLS